LKTDILPARSGPEQGNPALFKRPLSALMSRALWLR